MIDQINQSSSDVEIIYDLTGPLVLNSGQSDNPVMVQTNGVKLSGFHIKKTVKNRRLIVFGPSATASLGTPVDRCAFTKGVVDGGSVIDDTDDYSCVNAEYVKNFALADNRAFDCSVAFRVGWLQNSTVPVGERRARQVRAVNNTIENSRWFGLEMHGVEDAIVSGNLVKGGANSNFTDSLAYRFVRFRSLNVFGNIATGNGRGIGTSASAETDGENLYGNFTNNVINGCTAGEAFSMSGPNKYMNVQGNNFVGSGQFATAVACLSSGNLGTLGDINFENNLLVASNNIASSILRLNNVYNSDIKGNRIRSLGAWSSGTKRAILATDCLGRLVVQGNTLDHDYGWGFEDNAGKASLRSVLLSNLFNGPNLYRQVNSAGQLVATGNIAA